MKCAALVCAAAIVCGAICSVRLQADDVRLKQDAANAADADGTTPLHWAVRAGDLVAVRSLLRDGASAKATNRYGVTPLALAAENGDAAIIEALLASGADAK